MGGLFGLDAGGRGFNFIMAYVIEIVACHAISILPWARHSAQMFGENQRQPGN
jgi:hypothetical protein